MKNWMMFFAVVVSFGFFGCSEKETVREVKIDVPGETVFVDVPGETITQIVFTNELLVELFYAKGPRIVQAGREFEEFYIGVTNFNMNPEKSITLPPPTFVVDGGNFGDAEISAVLFDGNTEIGRLTFFDGQFNLIMSAIPVIPGRSTRFFRLMTTVDKNLPPFEGENKFFRVGITGVETPDNSLVVAELPAFGPMNTIERGSLLLSRGNDIFSMGLLTGEEVNLTKSLSSLGFNMNPIASLDRKNIVFLSNGKCRQQGVYLMRADGSNIRRLTGMKDGRCLNNNNAGNPSFSPDGENIVFAEAVFEPEFRTDIFLINISTGKLTQLTDDVNYESGPVFSAEGDRIYFSSFREWNGRLRTSVYELLLGDRSIHKLTDGEKEETYPSVNPIDGKVLFVETDILNTNSGFGRERLAVFDPSDDTKEYLTKEQTSQVVFLWNPMWSLSGERIIVTKATLHNPFFPSAFIASDVLIMDPDGDNKRRVPGIENSFGRITFTN